MILRVASQYSSQPTRKSAFKHLEIMKSCWIIQQVTYHVLCPILVDFGYIFSDMLNDWSQIFLCVARVVVLCGPLANPQKPLVSNTQNRHHHC